MIGAKGGGRRPRTSKLGIVLEIIMHNLEANMRKNNFLLKN